MKQWKKILTLGMLNPGMIGLAQLPKEVAAEGSSNSPVVAKNLQGWVKEGQSWKYYQNQKAVTGWLQTGNVWYHFDGNGVMDTGWKKISGVWYHFNANGYMKTGWLKDGNNWYYFNNNGNMKTGWQKISGVWYYFKENGHMQTGWLKTGGVWYYFNGNGNMKTGWQKISGVWYFFNNNGYMMTGWQKISNTWYYFNANGSMKVGWLKTGGVWYYFNRNGSMKVGWLKQGNNWYYFDNNGAMKTGALYLGTHRYYFNDNGAMIEDVYYPQNKPDTPSNLLGKNNSRITMPTGATVQAFIDYKAGRISSVQYQAILAPGKRNNHFVSNNTDKTIKIKNMHDVTPAMQADLTGFALEIINNIRSSYGVPLLTATKGAQKFVGDIVTQYNNDNWQIAFGSVGHNVQGIIRASDMNGLRSGGNYYENLGAPLAYQVTNDGTPKANWGITYDDLKKAVYSTISQMLFEDEASSFGHLSSLLGPTAESSSNFASQFDNYGQLHFVVVNGFFISNPALYDRTPLVVPTGNEIS